MSRRVAPWLLAGAVGWSCAYYNGLYNANRLASDAARARREGRTGEARSLWQQAAVKAESIAIRYPRSRYRDDALLLQGRALFEAEECEQAIVPLALVADSSADLAHRRQSRLLLGQCRVLVGDVARARATLSPLVDDQDAAVSLRARVWRARAALAQADYAGALADLTGVADTAAVFDRADALLGMGNAFDAAATLARTAPAAYDERRWPGALDRLGDVAPDQASILVDSLLQRGNLSRGQSARLLLADATRWERAGNNVRSRQRLVAARDVAADSVEGRLANARLTLIELHELSDVDRVPDLVDRLKEMVADGGDAGMVAGATLEVLSRVASSPRDPAPDLRQFLMAELVRDSLQAPTLAAALFRRLQRDFPLSPIAPKALLAAAMLEPDSAAALVAIVDSLYPDSPYRLVIRTDDDRGFTQIEDSLRTLLDSTRTGTAGPPRPAPVRRPGVARDSTSRPSTGRRVPEP